MVDPTLTGEEMMQYPLSTAATGTDGSHIIDPVQFIQTLQTERGDNNSRPRKGVGCFTLLQSPSLPCSGSASRRACSKG